MIENKHRSPRYNWSQNLLVKVLAVWSKITQRKKIWRPMLQGSAEMIMRRLMKGCTEILTKMLMEELMEAHIKGQNKILTDR
jgi:hypothetical protein